MAREETDKLTTSAEASSGEPVCSRYVQFHVQRKRGRPSILGNMQVGEVRIDFGPKNAVARRIRKEMTIHPERRYSWDLDAAQGIEVRRDL